MNTVTIELKRGDSPARLDFIAWKDDRQSFYAKPHNGKPRVIAMTAALPRGAAVTKEPFPDCPPVRVAPCILLPPPCRGSKDEGQSAHIGRTGTERGHDSWEDVYLKTHGLSLYLVGKDDAPLLHRLSEYKKAALGDYEREKAAIMRISNRAEQTRQIEAIEIEYNSPARTVHGVVVAGILNMTLDMAKRGCCGIRDGYLVDRWAKRQGIDLAEMARLREECRVWIEGHAGTPAINFDMRKRTAEPGFAPLNYGDRDEAFMALCAGVRYRVEFADGRVSFLADCSVRPELRAEEWKELRRAGSETAHERRVRKARAKGGTNSTKVPDGLTRNKIVARIKAEMTGKTELKRKLKLTPAAMEVESWYKKTYPEVKPVGWKTMISYYKQSNQGGRAGKL